MKDNSKICFITCVNDDVYYEEILLYLQQLSIPLGMTAEFIAVREAKSMAAGYNAAMKKSNAKYKIYLHQDCFLLNKNAIKIIIELFQADSEVGMVGLVGCKKIPDSGIWWEAEEKLGKLVHADFPENIYRSVYGDFKAEKMDVEAVDGFFMATQYDISWREELFDGWHFYDISQCLEFQRHGYKIVIPRQMEAWALHATGDKILGTEYNNFRKVFLQEYISI